MAAEGIRGGQVEDRQSTEIYLQNNRAFPTAFPTDGVHVPLPSTVEITKVANGFIVKVGCKTLVAMDWRQAAEGLALYWKDPKKAEVKYCKEK